jgi:hypothetical protein
VRIQEVLESFSFFPIGFNRSVPHQEKREKNKTRTDNNNNSKKRPFKVKIHGARLGTPKNGGGAMSSQFSISTFTFAPGILFCLFFDSFLFLVHLHDASTSIIRLGAFEKRRRPIFFSFGRAVTDRPRQSRDAKQKRPGPKRKTDIVGYNNGRPTSGERGVKRVTRRQQNYQTRFPECFETKPEEKWNSFKDQKQAESDLYILC